MVTTRKVLFRVKRQNPNFIGGSILAAVEAVIEK